MFGIHALCWGVAQNSGVVFPLKAFGVKLTYRTSREERTHPKLQCLRERPPGSVRSILYAVYILGIIAVNE